MLPNQSHAVYFSYPRKTRHRERKGAFLDLSSFLPVNHVEGPATKGVLQGEIEPLLGTLETYVSAESCGGHRARLGVPAGYKEAPSSISGGYVSAESCAGDSSSGGGAESAPVPVDSGVGGGDGVCGGGSAVVQAGNAQHQGQAEPRSMARLGPSGKPKGDAFC